MVDAGNESCVIEATSIASAQGRLEGVRFGVLVFTNLSQDHLDFHGTMDEYFEAKRRLFGRAARAAVNVGDPWGRRLAEELPDAITFGFADDADLTPEALDGIDLKLHGRFNVENALAAAAAAQALGVGYESIVPGLEAVEGVPGRFESIDERQPFVVLVDYAHKPDALENVLRAAREVARAACSASSAAAATATAASARRWGGSRPSSPTARSSPPTTRAPRIPWRSSTRCSPARPTSRSSPTAPRRSGSRSRAPRPATSS